VQHVSERRDHLHLVQNLQTRCLKFQMKKNAKTAAATFEVMMAMAVISEAAASWRPEAGEGSRLEAGPIEGSLVTVARGGGEVAEHENLVSIGTDTQQYGCLKMFSFSFSIVC
jgi:hypothetical protein